jgi:predicted ribosome quality control (RQC) complex YloA/Tae2 family protein
MNSNFRKFKSPSGCDILVGRNARQNDVLVQTCANSNATWFHIDDWPGSHVILLESFDNLVKDDAQFCANLAVKYSSQRKQIGCKFRVCACNIKDVKKERNSSPGEVVVENTIMLWGVV